MRVPLNLARVSERRLARKGKKVKKTDRESQKYLKRLRLL